MRSYALAAILAGAGLASAQSFNLSQTCQQTLQTAVGSSDAACLNLGGLAGLALNNDPNASIIQPVDQWLSGLCSKPACTNSSLQAIVQNITSGCSQDLSSIGLSISDQDKQQAISIVQQAYPTVRNVMCLKNGNTNCVTETLTNIQNTFGTLSVNGIQGIVAKAMTGGITSVPKNITCTDCLKQAYNVVNKDFPQIISGGKSDIENQCGTDFTNGQSPSGISEGASTSSSSSTSSPNAAYRPEMNAQATLGLLFSGLTAVGSSMFFLA